MQHTRVWGREIDSGMLDGGVLMSRTLPLLRELPWMPCDMHEHTCSHSMCAHMAASRHTGEYIVCLHAQMLAHVQRQMLRHVQRHWQSTDRYKRRDTVSAMSTPSLKSRAMLRFGRDSGTVSTHAYRSWISSSEKSPAIWPIRCTYSSSLTPCSPFYWAYVATTDCRRSSSSLVPWIQN